MDVIYHIKPMLTAWGIILSESWSFARGAIFLAASRCFQLATFFLPLKILIIVSSGIEPSYMEWFPWYIELDNFVIMLICLVPIFYVFYIFCGILSRSGFDKSLVIFLNKRELSEKHKSKNVAKLKKVHNHMGKAGAELVLIITSLFFISVLNYFLSIMTISLILLSFYIILNTAMKMQDQDRFGILKLHRRQCIEYGSSVNFILMFVGILTCVKYFDVGVIEAIFILLVSRMLFQSFQRYCVELLYINTNDVQKV